MEEAVSNSLPLNIVTLFIPVLFFFLGLNSNLDEVKKLLNFCDLNWSSSCVEFYKSKNSVSTASLAKDGHPFSKPKVAAGKC